MKFFHALSLTAGLAAADWAAPVEVIDLDLPPEQRWYALAPNKLLPP